MFLKMRGFFKMRTIKFRAWDIENKKFIPYHKDTYIEIVDGDLYEITSESCCGGIEINRLCSKIMQFTGFKDLNGREIYEGDIIKYVNQLYKVEFFRGSFFLRDSSKYDGDSDLIYGIYFPDIADLEKSCEIIGNVFENQELLK